MNEESIFLFLFFFLFKTRTSTAFPSASALGLVVISELSSRHAKLHPCGRCVEAGRCWCVCVCGRAVMQWFSAKASPTRTHTYMYARQQPEGADAQWLTMSEGEESFCSGSQNWLMPHSSPLTLIFDDESQWRLVIQQMIYRRPRVDVRLICAFMGVENLAGIMCVCVCVETFAGCVRFLRSLQDGFKCGSWCKKDLLLLQMKPNRFLE